MEDSNLIKHAKREFLALGYKPDDPEEGPDKWIQENVLELLRVFSAQGHSGSSAPYAIGMFSKLAAFEPLCPLSGADDEWVEVSPGLFQNNRCSHVFRKDGEAYDIEGIIFREPNGCCYTSHESHVPVTFPYIPTSRYMDVPPQSQESPS